MTQRILRSRAKREEEEKKRGMKELPRFKALSFRSHSSFLAFPTSLLPYLPFAYIIHLYSVPAPLDSSSKPTKITLDQKNIVLQRRRSLLKPCQSVLQA